MDIIVNGQVIPGGWNWLCDTVSGNFAVIGGFSFALWFTYITE